jgi:hypothetical protein
MGTSSEYKLQFANITISALRLQNGKSAGFGSYSSEFKLQLADFGFCVFKLKPPAAPTTPATPSTSSAKRVHSSSGRRGAHPVQEGSFGNSHAGRARSRSGGSTAPSADKRHRHPRLLSRRRAFPAPDQATNGADRGPFVIQMTHKRPRNDVDPATNGHTKSKIRGTRTKTTAKRRLFNDFPVPQTMWDRVGTRWDMGQRRTNNE